MWKFLYRAVDKAGKTVGILLTAIRDKTAASRFFEKAMCHNDDPELPIEVQQINYLSNIVEQDHRAIKLMLNFKSFRSAGKVWAGIELMYMIRKGQMMIVEVWEEIKCLLQINFYALAG